MWVRDRKTSKISLLDLLFKDKKVLYMKRLEQGIIHQIEKDYTKSNIVIIRTAGWDTSIFDQAGFINANKKYKRIKMASKILILHLKSQRYPSYAYDYNYMMTKQVNIYTQLNDLQGTILIPNKELIKPYLKMLEGLESKIKLAKAKASQIKYLKTTKGYGTNYAVLSELLKAYKDRKIRTSIGKLSAKKLLSIKKKIIIHVTNNHDLLEFWNKEDEIYLPIDDPFVLLVYLQKNEKREDEDFQIINTLNPVIDKSNYCQSCFKGFKEKEAKKQNDIMTLLEFILTKIQKSKDYPPQQVNLVRTIYNLARDGLLGRMDAKDYKKLLEDLDYLATSGSEYKCIF